MNTANATIGSRFNAVWKNVYGEELPEKFASEYANDLLELGKIVYRNRILSSRPSHAQ